jgi:hypothetical protein
MAGAVERLLSLVGGLSRGDISAGQSCLTRGFTMTHAKVLVPLPQSNGGNYEAARFNALRHGVLSQYTVLPWEDGEEYRALLDALVAEHRPQGPTEEHLVEELAGIIWRKRRLRLGEAAAHHHALRRATEPYHGTAKAALIRVPHNNEIGDNAVADAITITDEQTAADLADLESDMGMTEAALRLLNGKSATAYTCALAELREDTREWWEEQLAWEPDDCDEDQTHPTRRAPRACGGFWKPRSSPGTTSGDGSLITGR